MASALENFSDLARRQIEFFENNKFWEAPLKNYVVSKTFKGQGQNLDPRTLVCGGNDECVTHHTSNPLRADELLPHACDSAFSEKYLQGWVDAGHTLAFGHVMDVGFAGSITEFWEKRGTFWGAFNVLDRNNDPVLEASMDGMINVGTVREPLNRACEKCHMVGRWHGRVNGHMTLPDKKPAYLTAVLAMDVSYEEGRGFNPVYVGSLEGMIIRECGSK